MRWAGLLSDAGELAAFADVGVSEGDEAGIREVFGGGGVTEVHVGGFAVRSDAGPLGAVHQIGIAGAGEVQPHGDHLVGDAVIYGLVIAAGAVGVSEDVVELRAVEDAQAGGCSEGAYVREAVEESVGVAGEEEGTVGENGVSEEMVGGGVEVGSRGRVVGEDRFRARRKCSLYP